MASDLIIASSEYESDAFENNILRLEVLADGCSVLTSFNSKHEITAQSFHGLGKVGHA